MNLVVLAIIVVCWQASAEASSNKQCDDKSTCITMDFLQKLLEKNDNKKGDDLVTAIMPDPTGETGVFIDMKKRPMFFASLKADFILYGIDAVLKFDDVKINRGSGYHPSTGAFRAPRSGAYHISCTVMAVGNGKVQFHLMKNGIIYTSGHAGPGYFETSTLSVLMELKKGDTVYIKHRTNTVQRVHGSTFSNFSGYFLEQ